MILLLWLRELPPETWWLWLAAAAVVVMTNELDRLGGNRDE